MSRYINEDAIKYLIDIKVISTADVVEIVRCKDCKHQAHCSRNIATFGKGYDMYENISFCSYGERGEDE